GTVDRRTLQATLVLDRTSVDRIAAFLPLTQPVSGTTSGTVTVTVPLANPSAAVAQARLDTLEVTSGGIAARATQPVVASLRNRTVEFTTVELEGNGVKAAASGRIGLDARAPIDAHVTFDADLARAVHRPDLTVTGTAHGDVTLSGTREKPRAVGDVALSGVNVQRPDQTLVTLQDSRLHLEGDVAVVQNMRGTAGGGTFQLTGTIPVAALLPAGGAERLGLTPGVEAEVTLRWQGVQAAALLEVFRPGPSALRATLDGDATLA